MQTIEQALEVDIIGFCLTALLIMAAVAAGMKIIEEFSKIIGKPVKWVKTNNKDHEAITAMETKLNDHITEEDKKISELIQADAEIKKDVADLDSNIDKLTTMFVNKQISDMRFDIVDVASAITLGRRYSVEQLTHVLRIHDDYVKILNERGLTNGQVDMSIEVIKAEYRRLTQQQSPTHNNNTEE